MSLASDAIGIRFLSKPRLRRAVHTALAGLMSLSFIIGFYPTPAQAQFISFIRDAETEELLRDYARPIFKAAGLDTQDIAVHIVKDAGFNAFVVDGRNMFINYGTLMKSATPNQVIGVVAHETGHIAGGHLAGLRQAATGARTAALMAQILGILVLGAGVAAGAGGDVGAAGAGILYGGQSAAQRTLLSYRRGQESSADQAAVRYLNATRQSTKGMLQTFEYFADQGLTSLQYADPYLQSHPMPNQRIVQLRDLAHDSPYFNAKDSPRLQLRHDLVRAKLSGFLDNPQIVFNRYPKSNGSLPSRYARTIASCRMSGADACLPSMKALVAEQPDNPYFWELIGEFMIRWGRAEEAVPPLRKAVKLAPKESLTRIMLAQALLGGSESARHADEAIGHLRKALVKEKTHSLGYRLLSQAYGRKQQIAQADLASAQSSLFSNDMKRAKAFATRAKTKFKRGSPGWLKADDIINYQPPSH